MLSTGVRSTASTAATSLSSIEGCDRGTRNLAGLSANVLILPPKNVLRRPDSRSRGRASSPSGGDRNRGWRRTDGEGRDRNGGGAGRRSSPSSAIASLERGGRSPSSGPCQALPPRI